MPDNSPPSAGSQDYVGDPRNDSVLISVNGVLTPRAEAKVSVFDSGFVLGDGVWEGLRLNGGRLAFLDKHFDRLWDGAKMLRIDIGLTRDELARRLFDVIEANGMREGVHIRLMVTRGVKRSPYQDPRLTIGGATIVVIPEWKLPKPEMLARGLSLFTVHIRRTGPAEQDQKLNSHSKLNCILACIQAMGGGRRRSADARRPRFRRDLQFDALLHRPQRRAVDLGGRPLPRRHHPRRGVARGAPSGRSHLREGFFAVRRLRRR
ncbi:MAG: aminotransferase class IV [Roseiarcus sp.]|jgi:branched-chain amino acid aminotransferase